MDKATRQRLYGPTTAMVECLFGVKAHFGLTNDEAVRMLATMVATLDDDQRGAFQAALEDIRKDMVAENVFERADVSIAVKQAADTEYKQ